MLGKTNRIRRLLMGVTFVASSATLSTSALAGAIWHVDADAAPGGNGLSWPTAFQYLQSALQNSELLPGDQIWVAAGTYKPSVPYCALCNPGQLTDRHNTFLLIDGVGIYGGFLGNAAPGGGETQLSQRDPETNITTLSGDLKGMMTPQISPAGLRFPKMPSTSLAPITSDPVPSSTALSSPRGTVSPKVLVEEECSSLTHFREWFAAPFPGIPLNMAAA